MHLPNFKLNPLKGSYSSRMIDKGILDFHQAASWVKELPYERNTDRANFSLVITEGKGTCSTKHALLRKLCVENNMEVIKLYTGIFKMNNQNTPGVGKVLQEYNLEYIPEAHCYLKYQGYIYDYTSLETNNQLEFITEKQISSDQIGDIKLKFHKDFLKQWVKDNQMNISFSKLWEIREECIQHLSNS
ncbi:hypothetical protein E3U55_13705 [Filobacillus milosensis]|uniref:Transglutaminase-like domain-containing protein n=1 Tax=Filobacillus milosensis TaxID=94137 RepID=A0A4Y8IHQ9_9BACI|nr:hypothetical protein [Filobacillus milosensis]TFB14233.1 hypothetical protein E3U55_13705 [Filobacillus milosensis]